MTVMAMGAFQQLQLASQLEIFSGLERSCLNDSCPVTSRLDDCSVVSERKLLKTGS